MSVAIPHLGHLPVPALWHKPWEMMSMMVPPDTPPGGQFGGPLADRDNACKDSLLSVIEKQIIPRLLQANALKNVKNSSASLASSPPKVLDIQNFAIACLSADEDDSHDRLMNFRHQGLNTDQLFLHVIAPAARFLGVQWETDQLDFSQVTLGLLRLHQLSHKLGYAYREGPQQAGARRRIMLASAPGSQHLLGLTIVSEFFRKERWQVVVEISATAHELGQAVANEWFDMLGLSVGVVEQLQDIPSLISALRRQSRNPSVQVLLGGPAFLLQPSLATDLGADGISLDAAEAVVLADRLLQPDALPPGIT